MARGDAGEITHVLTVSNRNRPVERQKCARRGKERNALVRRVE